MQHKFEIEWVKISHAEFTGSLVFRNYKKYSDFAGSGFFQNMQELIATAKYKLLCDVFNYMMLEV